MTDQQQPDDGILMVRRTAYGRPPVERETRIPVPLFEGPVARIAIGTSVTRRMTNEFEFMKVEVRIELPCYPNDTDIAATAEFANHMIENMLGTVAPEPDHPLPIAAPVVPRHTPGTPIA